MKTFKQHILEKLKVSSKNTVTMTNEEFFNLLMEYTNTANIYALITAKVYNYQTNEMPLYSENITRYINTVKPYIGGHNQIILELRDVYEGMPKGYVEINIERDGDQIVSFTSEEWLYSMIKYMQDIINSK
jgi:hypothetical protein